MHRFMQSLAAPLRRTSQPYRSLERVNKLFKLTEEHVIRLNRLAVQLVHRVIWFFTCRF